MDSKSLLVRPARKEDVTAILALVSQVLEEFGIRFGEGSKTDDELRDLPSSYEANGGAFWIALSEGGSVLGTCGVFPVEVGLLELRKMYLAPESRGQGIGQKLFEQARSFAFEQGARALVLDTRDNMQSAIAFYERNGFVRDDSQIRGARCSRGYRLDLMPLETRSPIGALG